MPDEKPKEELSDWAPNTIYYCGKCNSTFPTDAFHGCEMPPKVKVGWWPPREIRWCYKCSGFWDSAFYHECIPGRPPAWCCKEGFERGALCKKCPSNEGVKHDQDKLKWHLLPFKALEGMVKVLTFGASKYSENGWRTVPNARDRYLSALLRHLCAIQMGEKVDSESGLRHIDHLLCNAAFLAELED